jgi:uncharacterized RDD family membrane protein YckC
MENTLTDNYSNSLTTPVYAGFGQRFVAALIDGLALGAVQNFVIQPLLVAAHLIPDINAWSREVQSRAGTMGSDEATELMGDTMGMMMKVFTVLLPISLLINAAYYGLMESSEKQATLGKMAMGLKVTDMEGNRITLVKALIRYFGKMLSGIILFIGYLMAAFTEKKQALHDIIAGTLVLKAQK